MHVELVKTFTFEAAHRLPHVAPSHKCHRLHGHSFRVDVHVAGQVDPHLGWLMDYADIAAAWAPLHDVLDHQYLNEIEGLDNPTSEVLAGWIWLRLQGTLEGLAMIEVAETCVARCLYRGPIAPESPPP